MQHRDTMPLIPDPEIPANPFDGLISIIIPTFNCATTLPRSIESLQKQTYPNAEIIVVDDASTDETEQIVKDLPVRYLRLEHNSGAAVARNTGAKAALGEIFLFAEADGFYDPDYVELILRHMHLPGVVGAINLGRVVWTSRNSAITRHHNDLYSAAARRVWLGKRGTGAWAFHAAPFWEIGGYDPECRIGQDMDLVRRLFGAGGKTVVGGFSTLYHKDPDTLRKYWRRAYRGGYFSGRFQAKWRTNDKFKHKAFYVLKFLALAAAPLYLAAALLLHWTFAIPFAGVCAYLLTEDPTTTLAWSYSLRRLDIPTFFLTPFFLYYRRLAIGWGRVKSFVG